MTDFPETPPPFPGDEPRQPHSSPPPRPPQPEAGPVYGRREQPYYSMQPSPPPPRKPRSFFSTIIMIFGVLAFMAFAIFALGIGVVFIGKMVSGGEGGSLIGDRIGLLRIEGPIMPGSDTEFWLDSLRDFGKQKGIRGIILRIDSPGGSVGASQEVQSMVMRLRKESGKTVYVSMGDVAASGGYYIASGADRIFSLKGTLTGSIGVIMSKPDISKLAEKIGFDTETIKTGRFKDSGAATRQLTPIEREMFDNLIGSTYNQFLDDVLSERSQRLAKASSALTPEQWASYKFLDPLSHEPREYLRVLADGRAYTGQQALDLGLVDEIGTLDDTIRAMGEKLNMRGWPAIETATRKATLRELLTSQLGSFLPAAQSPLQYRMSFP